MSVTEDDLATVTVSAERQSRVRRPRAIVKLNDVVVDGWLEWSVSNNTYAEADTFNLVYAASALPAKNNARWLSGQPKLFVEILVGFLADADPPDAAPSQVNTVIYGRVDSLEFDPIERIITLTGRDLTGALIDKPCREDFINQHASDIANRLALSHELSPVVTDTSAFVGTVYADGHTVLQGSGSEWDLLTSLAQQEGFVCYVTDQRLYFGPDITGSVDPYDLTWTPPTDDFGSPRSNVMQMSFTRSVNISAGAQVTVRSIDRRRARTNKFVYPPTAGPDAVQYLFTRPTDTELSALERYAKAAYATLVSHEMKLNARLPGDNVLSVSTPIRVTGTDTPFDQIYYPRLIERAMSAEYGYEMSVDAQNHSPNLMPAETQQQLVPFKLNN